MNTLLRPLASPSGIGHWINDSLEGAGHQFGAHRTMDVHDPSTGLVMAKVALADEAVVGRAVAAAKAALPGWSGASPLRRARVMFKFRQLLEDNAAIMARIISSEHGKLLDDAMGEVTRGMEVVEFACGAPHLLKGDFSDSVGSHVDSFCLRQPLGVVVGITPFNFPAMVPLWMFPVALVCGNTFVLKPSEKTPSASLLLAGLLQRAGLPSGVFNVVQGDRIAVEALLGHPDIKAVSFVGSTSVARAVYMAGTANGKRVQALGGAKNHLIVMPDVDLDQTVEAIVGAAYGSAGERCMAVSVVVAIGTVGDPLVARLQARLATLQLGTSDDLSAEMGPLVSDQHRAKVMACIEAGAAEGARLLVDGRDHEAARSGGGYFLGPTLFDGVQPHMRIYREEIFGPVLCVIRADSLDQALQLIEAHEYGNGAAIFTRDGGMAREFCARVQAGMVGVNVPIPVPMAFHSFGGWKSSLFGDHYAYGMEGVRFYTQLKTVTQRWKPDAGASGFVMPTLN